MRLNKPRIFGLGSQKAKNLARDDRLSLTIDHDTADLMEITGLSMVARAHVVEDRADAEKVLRMLIKTIPADEADVLLKETKPIESR